MICIRSQEIKILGRYIFIDNGLAGNLEKFIKTGDLIHVFDNEQVTKFRVFGLETSRTGASGGPSKKLSIRFSEYNKTAISRGVYESLFSQKRYHIVPENTALGWISIGSSLARARPPVLNIRIKKGSYIRFIYHNTQDEIFIENYLQWEKWIGLQEELHGLRKEIDTAIKNSNISQIDEIKTIIREMIENIFIKLGIPLAPENCGRNDYSLLDVYINGKGIYLPLEILNRTIVQYLLPMPVREPAHLTQNFTIIFSNKIDNTGEINSLKKLLENRFDIEAISDEAYQGCKYEVRNSCYFHFSGHGEIHSGKGMIELNKVLTDRVFYSKRVHMAFLNCCFTGLETDGVILNLLENGTKFVIASPYEITGNTEGGFSEILDFYSFMQGADASIPFFLNSVKNNNFSLFYRLYGRYADKI